MFDSPSSNNNFKQILKDPNTSLETVVSSKDFSSFWEKSNSSLFNFLFDHYDELIEIGFQTKHESINSIKCLQIISTTNQNFHHLLLTKTNLLHFVYDYLFNISSYPYFSQTNYFYVLPNLMVDKSNELNPIFDAKYFTELFTNIDNDYVFNFLLRLFEFAPHSILKVLKDIKVDLLIVSNILKYNLVEMQSKKLLIRNQILFKELASSKYEGDVSEIIHKHIGKIIRNAIKNPNVESISFLVYLDKISISKTSFSKWHKVHLKITPYLPNFCNIILNSNDKKFTPLYESCTLLAISIVSSTKDVPEVFINLFKYLLELFFTLKTNTFLHNCFVKMLKTLVSAGQINAAFLDDLGMFTRITECYINRQKDGYSPYWGQIRQIADIMNQYVHDSKTVDIEKWEKIVMKKNAKTEKITKENYGGYVPLDFNGIKRYFLRREYFNPVFTSKNLMSENNQPKKFLITSPFY